MSDGGFYERVGTNVENRTERAPAAPRPAQGGMPDQSPQSVNFGTGFKRWGAIDSTAFYGVAETHDTLPAGVYRCGLTPQGGPLLIKQAIATDNLIELPDDASAGIIAEFKTFWEIGDKLRARGFLQKRGYMFWGPPGSGKTSTLQILMKRMKEDLHGVVLLVDDARTAAACLQLARGIEPKRPMIAVLEDLDALVARYGEHEYLALLDGEAQVDNICFISTTNYPERLDRRFVNRPSRFDTVTYVPMPSAEARRVYLKTKEPSLTEEELEVWVRVSEGFSVAHLKEMIIAVRCFGQPLEAVVARLERMQERKPTSDDPPDKQSTFGFATAGNGRHSNGAEVRP